MIISDKSSLVTRVFFIKLNLALKYTNYERFFN